MIYLLAYVLVSTAFIVSDYLRDPSGDREVLHKIREGTGDQINPVFLCLMILLIKITIRPLLFLYGITMRGGE